MPSDALPRASSTIRVFSGTLAPLIGLVIEKVPVVNANLSGAISGLPEASARWLPATSVMSALSANRTKRPERQRRARDEADHAVAAHERETRRRPAWRRR